MEDRQFSSLCTFPSALSLTPASQVFVQPLGNVAGAVSSPTPDKFADVKPFLGPLALPLFVAWFDIALAASMLALLGGFLCTQHC